MQQTVQIKNKERESNIELCRLACMFYIVVYHLFIHNLDVTGGAYYSKALTTIFSIGVPVFVMISGYFKIKATVKGFLSIVSQVVFYSVIADLVCVLIFRETLNIGNVLSTFFPVTKTEYWFVKTYLLLYLLSPFVNRLLHSFTKKEFLIFLATLTLLVCYGGGIMNRWESDYGDRSIMTFAYFYSIGCFIREYGPDISLPMTVKKYSPWLVYIIVMVVFFTMVSFIPGIIGKGVNFLARSYNTIGLMFFSVLFFLCFKNLKLQKRWINSLAKSTFAIYLIHGNNIVTYHRWIYDPYTKYGVLIENIHLKFIYLLAVAFAICVGCIIIDQIRRLIFKYLGVEYIIDKTDLFFRNKLARYIISE